MSIKKRLLHIGSLMSQLYPRPPVYMFLCVEGQRRQLHSSPWNCMSLNAYNYIHTANGLISTYIGQVHQPYST